MIKILFLCLGNICRSPMAEYVMKDMVSKAGLSSMFEISSRGTSREEEGNPIYPQAKKVLLSHGINPDGHRAKRITKEDYDYFDYIIAMDDSNIRKLNSLIEDEGHKVSKLLDRDVADPWYTGNFDETWDDIYYGCRILLERLMA